MYAPWQNIFLPCVRKCAVTNNTGAKMVISDSTTRGYRTARLKLGDNYIVYRLQDVQYMLRIFYMIHMQQMRYLESMPDIMKYAANALTAIDYVEPHVNANKYIVYPQLFDELKAFW
jgi:hypothetical protein